MFHAMRLGRKQPDARRSARLPRLSDVADLVPPRAFTDWSSSVASWAMSCNDVLGTCTIAAAANYSRQMGVFKSPFAAMTDDEVRATYTHLGWNPAIPATDKGLVETVLLDLWRDTGLMIGGKLDKIDGYASIAPSLVDHVRCAIDMVGGVMVGAAMPLSAQNGGPSWDVVPGPAGVPDSWGGHEFLINSHDATGFGCITWGQKQRLTLAWFQEYVVDVNAVLSRDWIFGLGNNPAWFDWPAIAAAT